MTGTSQEMNTLLDVTNTNNLYKIKQTTIIVCHHPTSSVIIATVAFELVRNACIGPTTTEQKY